MIAPPLLDTHVWIWWLHAEPALPAKTATRLDALAKQGHKPHLSDISLWEAQMLFTKGRLTSDLPFDQWLARAVGAVSLVRLDVKVIRQVHALPTEFHGDPADRLIVASALAHNLPMATLDGKIQRSGLVEIWE